MKPLSVNVDAIVTSNRWFGWVVNSTQFFKKLFAQGIVVQFVVATNSTGDGYYTRVLEGFPKNSSLTIRFTSDEITPCTAIYDSKEALISTSGKTEFTPSYLLVKVKYSLY